MARQFMQTYADGDAAAIVAILHEDWVLHEADGSLTSCAQIAEITESHRESFPEKEVEFVLELVDGNYVAQNVRFTLVHTGRYYDLEPTGKRVQLSEMIFHLMRGDVIGESWRMTYPAGVYDLLSGTS